MDFQYDKPSGSNSSTAHAPVEFNYAAPEMRPDGNILIRPLFNPSPSAYVGAEKNLRIVKNSEIPLLMKAAGELTPEEDRASQYLRMVNEQKIFVGDQANSVFTAVWLDESVVASNPRILSLMQRLREIILVPSAEAGTEQRTAFEVLLPGGRGKGNKAKFRSYGGGFSLNPQETDAQTSAITKKVYDDPERLAEVSRILGEISDYYLRLYVPKRELDLMDHHADVQVPLVFGGVERKHCSSWHMNLSSEGQSEIELSIGAGGEMHTDDRDDFRRWTVLLALGNIRDGSWPGRTMITDLRAYTVMAPFTVLIFKAVRPHKSLGPAPPDPTRQPYVPAATGLPQLGEGYMRARLTIANYMKLAIANNSPAILRTSISANFAGKKGTTSNPDSLRLGLAAFGTVESQATFHAKAFAKNRARLAAENPDLVLSTAREISRNFGYRFGNEVRYPSEAAIQQVLDGNGPETPEMAAWQAEFDRYELTCQRVLSMITFPKNRRTGEIRWVEKVGSSFANEVPIIEETDSNLNKEQQLKISYGLNPYTCEECQYKFKGEKAASQLAHHMKVKHANEVEYQQMGPTLDLPDETDDAAAGMTGSKGGGARTTARKTTANKEPANKKRKVETNIESEGEELM